MISILRSFLRLLCGDQTSGICAESPEFPKDWMWGGREENSQDAVSMGMGLPSAKIGWLQRGQFWWGGEIRSSI